MARTKTLRQQLGWPQKRLADYLGLAQSAIARLEGGQKEPGPVAKLLDQLEAALARGDIKPDPLERSSDGEAA